MMDAPFYNTARTRYSRYARHVLGFRHFAEQNDGMTPVQRRSVWTLADQLKAFDKAHLVKTARSVGDCTGKYHPHGSDSVERALWGLSQTKTRAPLIIGVGNWGSYDSSPAAGRYTSLYLSEYGKSFFDPDELSAVPHVSSYDGSYLEPLYLPARLPHLLLSGCQSMAPGISGNIPPCEPDWVLDSMLAVLNGKKPKPPKAFAYRWGGRLLSLESTWMTTGKGRATFRPTMRLDSKRNAIVLTSLAPGLRLDTLESQLEKCSAFGSLSAEPAPNDIVTIYITLARGASMEDLKREVFKRTKMSVSFSSLFVHATSDGDEDFTPKVAGPVEYFKEWIAWRKSVVVAAAAHRIRNLEADISRHDLMLRVISKRKELLTILDRASSKDAMRLQFAKTLKCSSDEAEYVMNVALYRLASLEIAPIKEKIAVAKNLIADNRKIEKNPAARLELDANAARKALANTLVVAAATRLPSTSENKRRGK